MPDDARPAAVATPAPSTLEWTSSRSTRKIMGAAWRSRIGAPRTSSAQRRPVPRPAADRLRESLMGDYKVLLRAVEFAVAHQSMMVDRLIAARKVLLEERADDPIVPGYHERYERRVHEARVTFELVPPPPSDRNHLTSQADRLAIAVTGAATTPVDEFDEQALGGWVRYILEAGRGKRDSRRAAGLFMVLREHLLELAWNQGIQLHSTTEQGSAESALRLFAGLMCLTGAAIGVCLVPAQLRDLAVVARLEEESADEEELKNSHRSWKRRQDGVLAENRQLNMTFRKACRTRRNGRSVPAFVGVAYAPRRGRLYGDKNRKKGNAKKEAQEVGARKTKKLKDVRKLACLKQGFHVDLNRREPLLHPSFLVPPDDAEPLREEETVAPNVDARPETWDRNPG